MPSIRDPTIQSEILISWLNSPPRSAARPAAAATPTATATSTLRPVETRTRVTVRIVTGTQHESCGDCETRRAGLSGSVASLVVVVLLAQLAP